MSASTPPPDAATFHLDQFRRMFAYSDWANQAVLSVAQALTDEQLDRPMDIGPTPGSLRRILVHTYNGELVWLERWKGGLPAWPSEAVKPPVAELAAKFREVATAREAFFAGLNPAKLEQQGTYRDSKGSMFAATLGDMLLQGFVHSAHHRAQAANAVRRLGGQSLELDYMTHVRVPAQ